MSDRWVCLMYHDVTAEAPLPGGGPQFFAVGLHDFERQLDHLASRGYAGCSLEAALAPPVRRCVAITFDDGDVGQATRAFPALAARRMTATFFVTTAWVGQPGYASWEQLREMKAAGMAIESHTHTHPFLSELDAPRLRDELRRSRELLDERLGQRTHMLALPGGDAPRPAMRDIVLDCGFDVVATSRWGTNRLASSGPLRVVRRCTVRGAGGDATFAATVAGERWLATRKRMREGVLAFTRARLGPTRYSALRRHVLDVIAHQSSG